MEYPSNWNKIRERVLERDEWACQGCCHSQSQLHVHHMRPISRGGNHEEYNLQTLCPTCHAAEHKQIRKHGLAMIWGPEQEAYRDYLTDPVDVEQYREYLDSRGIEVRF